MTTMTTAINNWSLATFDLIRTVVEGTGIFQMRKSMYWSGTHHGPRSSKVKYGKIIEFYIIEHTNGQPSGSFYLRRISRKPQRFADGSIWVRYDGLLYKLHEINELEELVCELGGVVHFDLSEDFDSSKHELLPFIKYFDKNEPTREP